MDNIELAKEWYKYAQYDLNTAIYLLDMKPRPNEIICYHCQQSAEKYLKGYLALKNERIIKTHDLQFLCKKASKINHKIEQIEDDCIELTDYAVEVRYPFHVDVNDLDVEKAIKSAKVIREMIITLSDIE